jgi:uncharacterized protein (DUF885 family)
MQKLLLFLCLLAVCACRNSHSKTVNQSGVLPIDSLFSMYAEERLLLYPLEATSAGDARYNDLLPNTIAQGYLGMVKHFYEKYKRHLQQYDVDKLSDADRMSYDILNWECDINLEDLTFHKELIPINQFDCLPLTIGQYASGTSAQPFKTVKDYENWLRRLDSYTVWCDTAVANMRRGMASGYVLPKVLAEKMLPQMKSFDHGPAEQHLFYSPIKQFPASFTPEQQARLTKSYKEMIEQKIIPTYQKLYAFIEKEYIPACRAGSGISELPNGAALYAHQIKQQTTTTMSADDIFNLGQQEVERIMKEMEEVKKQVGYTAEITHFFDYVRSKRALMPYTHSSQVIDHFNAIHEQIKPKLSLLFDLVPKTGFEVRQTEAFRENTASAEYVQGSVDGTRPGIFYVPVPDTRKYNNYADEDLFLHEAIPGHHFQVSLQQENTRLPKFRRTLWYSAYGEGWALYTESLGKELGLYTDPYQYFGMLSAEMHRAIRLVVDAGMHTKGWTREQAIAYSMAHEAEPEASIIAEVERYMSWPGQALSYKIGQLKIRELRAKAEKALGPKFDIRVFHNKVLEDGCVPLTILEGKVDKWIKGGED